MRIPTRLLLLATATALSFFGSAPSISAQRNPTMPEQQRENDKEALFAKFIELKQVPIAERQRLAFDVGKEYLFKFGRDNDANARTVQKFVTEYAKVRHAYEIDTAYGAKNYTKTFELGRPILKQEPDNFHVLAVMTEAGYDNLQAGNASLNAETIQYARKAIQLVDDGKVTQPDPFTSIDIARGYLNFTLGWLLKEQSPVEAAGAFLKAAQSDSPYRTEPLVYNRLGIAILKGEYQQLSAEYNEKFGNKPPSAEQQAMLEKIIHLSERAIDAYARAYALSNNPQQQEARTKMLAQLTTLYKTFHNNSDAGLNELLATVLSKPLPR